MKTTSMVVIHCDRNGIDVLIKDAEVATRQYENYVYCKCYKDKVCTAYKENLNCLFDGSNI